MSKIDNEAFDVWYDKTFGSVLGAQDEENRGAIKKVWNGVLDHVASRYEFKLFEEMAGDLLAQEIRKMKVK